MSGGTGIETSGLTEVQRILERLRTAAAGDSADFRPMYEQLGSRALKILQERFRNNDWEPIGFVTRILRRKGKRGKYVDADDVMNEEFQPLMDTGTLRQSFIQGSTSNVFELGNSHVLAGSSMPIAAKHNAGFSSVFQFGPEQESRFDQNVAKVLPGGRASGSSAKKNWNPFYFRTKASLRKMAGKSYRVPARRILPERFSSSELADFRRIIIDFVRRFVTGLNG